MTLLLLGSSVGLYQVASLRLRRASQLELFTNRQPGA
jgi:hypothetical protein